MPQAHKCDTSRPGAGRPVTAAPNARHLGKCPQALALVLVFGLAGCNSTPHRLAQADQTYTGPGTHAVWEVPASGSTPRDIQRGSAGAAGAGTEITKVALSMRGTPYVYGGSTPAGFDCSGLVQYAYAQAGIPVPRTAQTQFQAATRIGVDQAQPGDLLFFRDRDAWHVAIYVGRDKFVHAPWHGIPVRTDSLRDGFYRAKLIGVGRLIDRPTPLG